MTAPDDYTVVIELEQPDSGMLSGFVFISVLPEHILGTADRATITELPFWTTNERVGAGPFKFTNLVEGERVELVAHDGYHFGAPAIKNLNLLFFSSAETSLAAFQQGSSLAAPMTINDVELVDGIEGAESIPFPAGVGYIAYNLYQPYLRTSEFGRRWPTRSTRRRWRKRSSGSGEGGFHRDSLHRLGATGGRQPVRLRPGQGDVVAGGGGLDRRAHIGVLVLLRRSHHRDGGRGDSAVSAGGRHHVELQFDDGSGVRTQEMTDRTWDMMYGSFGAQPTPANLTAVWGPPGYITYGWDSPEFNAEMDAALLTYDQDEQAVHYQQAIRILNEEAPNVWLFDRQNLVAVNTGKLENSVWGPGHIMWLNNAQTWTVAE